MCRTNTICCFVGDRCLRPLFWALWFPLGFPLKLIENFSLVGLYRYVLSLLYFNALELVAGVICGFVLAAAIFIPLSDLGATDWSCAFYTTTWAYVIGQVCVLNAVVFGLDRPVASLELEFGFLQRAHLRTLPCAAYVGVGCGLLAAIGVLSKTAAYAQEREKSFFHVCTIAPHVPAYINWIIALTGGILNAVNVYHDATPYLDSVYLRQQLKNRNSWHGEDESSLQEKKTAERYAEFADM